MNECVIQWPLIHPICSLFSEQFGIFSGIGFIRHYDSTYLIINIELVRSL